MVLLLEDSTTNCDFVHAKDRTHEVTALPEGSTPSLTEREKRFVRKDGESIWARALRVPIRDAAGLFGRRLGCWQAALNRR